MNHIFYHLYYINDCEQRFLKTFKKIQDSGLYSNIEALHVNIVGRNVPSNFLANYSDKIKRYNLTTNLTGEMDTLRLMWDSCRILDPRDNVLYLHCKGVTKPTHRNVQAWVDYMEYFLIEKWQEALNALKDHDTCGVNLQSSPLPHYSGNFWWAKNSFIQRTNRFDVRDWPRRGQPRNMCEFWLLNHQVNPCNLYTSGVHHYREYYDESNYRT